jgi:hypothetical protein
MGGERVWTGYCTVLVRGRGVWWVVGSWKWGGRREEGGVEGRMKSVVIRDGRYWWL